MPTRKSRFLASIYAKRHGRDRNFGYCAPPTDRPAVRIADNVVEHLIADDPPETLGLWPALFQAWPQWNYGHQGTGDCVSWDHAHLLDVVLPILANAREIGPPTHRVATESIYGFGRVEVRGRPDYGGPGMSGYQAAEALTGWGYLLRRQYVGHDLRRYNGPRAIQWGRTGVPNSIERQAAQYKARKKIAVTTPEACAALVGAGYPVSYCGYTYWGRTRGRDGIATRFSSGWHAMTLTGRMYKSGRLVAFWVANTGHGDHCSGPTGPLPMPAAYAACGSWVPVDKVAPVLARGDCFAFDHFGGWPRLPVESFAPDWLG